MMDTPRGWIPWTGQGAPPEGERDVIVHVLLRGTPEHGHQESGPAEAHTFNWAHSQFRADFHPDPMWAITHPDATLPAGDIIGFCIPEAIADAERFPHVRADLGR